MGWYIILGTIPIGIVGLVFADQIESGARDLYLIGTTLIVLGFAAALRRARLHAATARSRASRGATAS